MTAGLRVSRPAGGDLLSEIMSSTLDADYQTAAERARASGGGSRRSGTAVGAVVVLIFGMMLAISAVRTQQLKPVAAAERDQLVTQIHTRQHHLDALQGQLSGLEADVAAAQSRAAKLRDAQRRTQAEVTSLAAITGGGAVSGPGLRVVASDAPGAVGGPGGGVILDTDMQTLVNALWSAGAEAIAINGNRVTSLTAIRFAGRAITVNFRSLLPPYVIGAIGDPDTLPARLLETPGGQAWLSLKANFGIGFDTQTVADLELPADPNLGLRMAQPAGTR